MKAGTVLMIFSIDPLHSLVEFAVQHLKISLVKGRFSDVRGTVTLDPQHPERAAITAEVAVESIYTRASRRDAHLRSADFFDVTAHPTITFKSNQLRLVNSTQCWLGGDLSLHGLTRPITFQATYTGMGQDPLTDSWRIGLSATTYIDRRDFGMNFNLKIADGIAAIGNETQITIYIEAIKQGSL
ncbi:MAG TPA: YceI family protein [Ktedonobacteraceae bacterium]